MAHNHPFPLFDRLCEYFEFWAKETPHQPALMAPGFPTLSHDQLIQQLTSLKEEFLRRGLGSSARIAILAANGPELALAFLATATYAISAPLNPNYQKEELLFFLKDIEASALLIQSSLPSPGRDVAQSMGIPVLEFSLQPENPSGYFTIVGMAGKGFVGSQSANSEELSLILHTSGTTAQPKQVPLTQKNLCASIQHIQKSLNLTPNDRCLNVMPLFHIHGLMAALLSSLTSGGSLVCPNGFSPTAIFDWFENFQPTWFTAVPTIHQAILSEATNSERTNFSHSLRFIRSSSASLAPTVMKELEQFFGVPVIEAYGMTEAAHQMASNPLPPGIQKPGSVGTPAGPDIQIVNELGQRLLPGERGEVVIRGPNVITGYSQNPEANAQAYFQEWFRTGDQGFIDEEGYLFLTGRLKEQINRGGEKIAPLEIDQVLLQHQNIEQAVCFGVSHPTLGEEVAAVVVLKKGATLTEQELRPWLSHRLAQYKVPKKVFFKEAIPKGPTGKIQRRIVAEQMTGAATPSPNTAIKKLEKFFLDQYKKTIGIEAIEKTDNFFVLGGDSIQATRIANHIQSQIPSLPIDVVTIFEHPTVAELHQFYLDNLTTEVLIEYCKDLK